MFRRICSFSILVLGDFIVFLVSDSLLVVDDWSVWFTCSLVVLCGPVRLFFSGDADVGGFPFAVHFTVVTGVVGCLADFLVAGIIVVDQYRLV